MVTDCSSANTSSLTVSQYVQLQKLFQPGLAREYQEFLLTFLQDSLQCLSHH